MPSTIDKCKLFRIKHTTVLEGETFLRNKHKTEFFEIKCTFCSRKENIIRREKNLYEQRLRTTTLSLPKGSKGGK